MLISIFEVIAIGIGYHARNSDYQLDEDRLLEVHKSLPTEMKFTSAAGSGIRASTRIPKTVQLGRESFVH